MTTTNNNTATADRYHRIITNRTLHARFQELHRQYCSIFPAYCFTTEQNELVTNRALDKIEEEIREKQQREKRPEASSIKMEVAKANVFEICRQLWDADRRHYIDTAYCFIGTFMAENVIETYTEEELPVDQEPTIHDWVEDWAEEERDGGRLAGLNE